MPTEDIGSRRYRLLLTHIIACDGAERDCLSNRCNTGTSLLVRLLVLDFGGEECNLQYAQAHANEQADSLFVVYGVA